MAKILFAPRCVCEDKEKECNVFNDFFFYSMQIKLEMQGESKLSIVPDKTQPQRSSTSKESFLYRPHFGRPKRENIYPLFCTRALCNSFRVCDEFRLSHSTCSLFEIHPSYVCVGSVNGCVNTLMYICFTV